MLGAEGTGIVALLDAVWLVVCFDTKYGGEPKQPANWEGNDNTTTTLPRHHSRPLPESSIAHSSIA